MQIQGHIIIVVTISVSRHSGSLGLRVDTQELCVAQSSIPCIVFVHPPRNLQSVSVEFSTHTSAHWTFRPGMVLLKTSTQHFILTGIVPVGRLCMLMWGGGGAGGSNFLPIFEAHATTL